MSDRGIADPRDVTRQMFGTPLRDGAVDPRPGDFLGPTNAGAEGNLGNPHDVHVVNPQIHGTEDNRTIPAGVVPDDHAAQQQKALDNLAEWQPQTRPAADEEPDPEPGA